MVSASKKRRWRLGLALLAAVLSAPGYAHGPHRHGEGRLEAAVDGSQLYLRLQVPLDSLLGFERPPRTAREREAARALLARLRGGQDLFAPTPAADCRLTAASVAAPVLEGGQTGDGHADLAAEWRYDCRIPEKLMGLLRLFADYPRLQRLEAVVAGPRGQRAARLSARKPGLDW